MIRRPSRAALAVAALAVAATGCASTPHPRVDIGLSKIALNRSFTDPKLPPEVIVRIIPAPPNVVAEKHPDLTQYEVTPEKPVKLPPIAPKCPTAPPGSTVPASAPFFFPSAPKPGRYMLHNKGTIALSAAGQAFKFPFPPVATMDVGPSRTVDVATVPGLPLTAQHVQFDILTTLSPSYTILERLQYDGATLDLVRKVVHNDTVTTDEAWSPPVELYSTAGQGSTWQDLASDQGPRHALAIQGSIDKKAVVDVCGDLVETVQASSTTTVADLSSGQTSGTSTGQSDVLRIATTYGPLFAQREQHTTELQTVNSIPVTVTTDAVLTLDSLTPSPVTK